MPLLALSNFFRYDLNGRALRVDSAAGGERSADEIALLQVVFFNTIIDSDCRQRWGLKDKWKRAHTVLSQKMGKRQRFARIHFYYINIFKAISRTVAALPPEKMFELMKQMKDVLRTNPNEAKQMLFSNPQLAYALLQVGNDRFFVFKEAFHGKDTLMLKTCILIGSKIRKKTLIQR